MTEPTAPAQEAPAPAPVVDADPSARLAILERELKEARSEAAKYRTTLRSKEQEKADEDAKRLKEQGDFKALYEAEQTKAADLAAAVARYEATQRQHAIARELGLPLELADRLRGDTPAELKADAQKLLELLKVQSTPVVAAPAPTAPTTAPTNPAATRTNTPAFDPKNPPRLSDIQWKK